MRDKLGHEIPAQIPGPYDTVMQVLFYRHWIQILANGLRPAGMSDTKKKKKKKKPYPVFSHFTDRSGLEGNATTFFFLAPSAATSARNPRQYMVEYPGRGRVPGGRRNNWQAHYIDSFGVNLTFILTF